MKRLSMVRSGLLWGFGVSRGDEHAVLQILLDAGRGRGGRQHHAHARRIALLKNLTEGACSRQIFN